MWKSPYSSRCLSEYSKVERIGEGIDLNFPGIGNGRLSREEVLPVIQHLPDNVHVWEFNPHE